jgi:hypothetical protein
MEPATQNSPIIAVIRSFLFHSTFILGVIFLLFVRILPLLLDPNLDYVSDEVFHAREIWEFLHGRELFFYYENVNYHGTFEGFSAIPFVKTLGFYPIPFKIPTIIYYGLFVWSTFLVLQTINSKAGWIAVIFLILSPQWVIGLTLLTNYVISPVLLLGNLTLFYFIKVKTNNTIDKKTIFLLCFFSGLAIYIWTYSIIYIFTIIFLLILTHPKWVDFRKQLSVKRLCQSFEFLKTKKEKIARFYDVVICLFLFAIIYAFIFGGFGLDIGGVTILQINNLHKPVLQLIPLIIIRLLMVKLGLLPAPANPLKHSGLFDTHLKRIILVGLSGFILGILPRIISILSGAVTRGGQGFDVDFSLLRIFLHIWELMKIFPSVMGIDFEKVKIFSPNIVHVHSIIHDIFLLPIAGLVSYSVYFFLKNHWTSIKNLARLNGLSFIPSLTLLILPVSLCASAIITMNGPIKHYLIPIYWSITVYVALFIADVYKRSKILSTSFLLIWVVFYGTEFEYSPHEFPKFKEAVVSNDQETLRSLLSRSQQQYMNLIQHLHSENINAVYAGYGLASTIIINSGGKIAAAEYHVSARGQRLRKNLEKYPDFALIVREGDDRKAIFLSFLKGNRINFKQEKVGVFIVYWDFENTQEMKDKLRSLLS